MKKGFLSGAATPKAARTSATPATAFFNTLTDRQRDILAGMGGMTAQERSEFGNAVSYTHLRAHET